MKNNPLVSIIILNYNGIDFLKSCLKTIFKQTYKNIEIIVTDNHSTDGSLEYLIRYLNITVIKNQENYGYAKANNIGAKKAKGQYLFFLNNDTELEPDTIKKLVEAYTPKTILSARQIPMWDKTLFGTAGGGMDIFGYPYADLDSKKTKIFYADGASFFIKKGDFLEIGMFDEKLFIFEEDIDFGWRAQMMGYKIKPCWEAIIYHFSGGTVIGGSSKKNRYSTNYFRRYLNEKNVIRNMLKNYSFPLCLILLLILLLLHFFEIIILLFLTKWKVVLCYLKAYAWNIKNINNTLVMRKKIQRTRQISDYSLMKNMYWSYSKLVAFSRHGMPSFIK